MGAYEPPVDQLLRIEDDLWARRKDWHDYLGMGIGPAEVPDLIRMVVDPDLNDLGDDSPKAWGPIHAWRALAGLRAEAAIPTLIGLMRQDGIDNYNDWITEELPEILGRIGPAAILELTKLIEDEEADDYAREDAGRALVEVVSRTPEERDGIVATLIRQLERAEWHARTLNAFLVDRLLRLEAKEAAGVIEAAYAGQFVDDSICGTWYDVWHALKLEGEPPPKTKRLVFIGPLAGFPRFDDPSPPSAKPPGWQPVKSRSPEERKDRNKSLQKLEKKVKGKGKGGTRR